MRADGGRSRSDRHRTSGDQHGERPAPNVDTGPDTRPFLDRLAATVELTAARSVLRQLIALANSSATLSDVELRERLTGLASLSSAAWGGVPARPGGCSMTSTPGRRPGNTATG